MRFQNRELIDFQKFVAPIEKEALKTDFLGGQCIPNATF